MRKKIIYHLNEFKFAQLEQDEGAVEYDDIENDVEDSAEDYDEYDDEDSAEEPIFYECWNTWKGIKSHQL